MIIPSVEQVEELSREELIDLVKKLLQIVDLQKQIIDQQQKRIEALEAEISKLRRPPLTSKNSSQPPSRDRKPDKPPRKKRKKHGPPFGHKKYSRPLVENPDRIIHLPVTECESCLADLSHVVPEDFEQRQITELPVYKPIVIETRRHVTTCPACHQTNRAPFPEGLEAERFFGPNLEATVVYFSHTQHMSCVRVVETMRVLYGVELSEGGVMAIIERAGKRAQPVAEQIKHKVISKDIVQSDETSARVNGEKRWHWVYVSDEGEFHKIVPTRGAKEIKDVMGSVCVEVWVCDCFGSQLNAPAKVFQLCLQHQIRDLQRVIDTNPKEKWAIEIQSLFREAIHLRNRADDMTLPGFLRRVTQIENRLDQLLDELVTSAGAKRLRNRYVKHQDKLLTFLHYPEVPPTNNEPERALRPSVVHRKVTNGFRSEWGPKAYAALQTIIATAKRKGEDVFSSLVKLMGTPVLPFLEYSGP